MKKSIKNMIAGLFIVITWLNVTKQYLDICNYYIDVNTYFNDIVFNPQKMLFNNLLGIMLCIYINTYDINRTEYVIREKEKILSAQIILGCKICAVYSFTVLAFIILPLFYFASYKIITLFFIYWVRLFAFNFMVFIIFTLFSIFIKRVISLFLILAIGFILLVSWNIYIFTFLNNDAFFATQNIWFHVGMIITLILISNHFLKNKEYIT